MMGDRAYREPAVMAPFDFYPARARPTIDMPAQRSTANTQALVEALEGELGRRCIGMDGAKFHAEQTITGLRLAVAWPRVFGERVFSVDLDVFDWSVASAPRIGAAIGAAIDELIGTIDAALLNPERRE